MNINAPLTFLGDSSLWSEDVLWFTEQQAWLTLGPFSQRIRWAHFYLEPQAEYADQVMSRIQLDLAGQELYSVVAYGSCPQSAMCAAFALLLREIEKDEPVMV